MSRRNLLKILFIFCLRALFPVETRAFHLALGPGPKNETFIMDGFHWDDRAGTFRKKALHREDMVSFIPTINLDGYEVQKGTGLSVQNIFQNIYEIEFTPIKRFLNNQKSQCYHYILKISPKILVFHFNWITPYWEYLQVGKYYRGYGMLGTTAGDPAVHNPFIPKSWTKRITKEAVIRQILVAYDDRDYFENQCPWKEGEVYTGGGNLRDLGYPHQYRNFQKRIRNIKAYEKMVKSTKDKDTYEGLHFRVELISKNSAFQDSRR